MRKYRLDWMWSAFVALLGIVTLAGLEGLSSLVVADWPARELRPVEATNLASLGGVMGAGALPHYNSWGLNDRERSLWKPAGAGCRAVMVGGSFLEGVCVSKPVGARVGYVWQAEGHRDMEVVSLGISATAPPQCSYRISNDLKGVRGSYRVSDRHWTEYGTRIAAKRIAAELLKLR